MNIENFLKNNLDKKNREYSLRQLKKKSLRYDFCSNDYLGLARSAELYEAFIEKLSKDKIPRLGSTGSRLISGNSETAENLEKKLSEYFLSESALLMNSGYHANLGLLSCIAKKSDTIFFDERCHASTRDGIRLSEAKSYSYKHNDIENLEKKMSLCAKGNIFIITEALFSMDGDFAKLKDITRISEKYSASVIIDEAHSTGILGEKGRGLTCAMNLEDKVFARVHTFGKSAGSFGACILGSKQLRDYLINNSRAFIFTTALPYFNLTAIDCAIDKLKESDAERILLEQNIEYFRARIPENLTEYFLESYSPIQGFLMEGSQKIKKVADFLKNKDLDVSAILHPSVPKGKERIRLTLHSFNTEKEINHLMETFSESLKKL